MFVSEDIILHSPSFNTLRPRQDGRHLTDNIFKHIFFNEDMWISINISFKFVPKGQINNIPELVQIMAWCRPGNTIWTNDGKFTDTYMHQPQWVNILSS